MPEKLVSLLLMCIHQHQFVSLYIPAPEKENQNPIKPIEFKSHEHPPDALDFESGRFVTTNIDEYSADFFQISTTKPV